MQPRAHNIRRQNPHLPVLGLGPRPLRTHSQRRHRLRLLRFYRRSHRQERSPPPHRRTRLRPCLENHGPHRRIEFRGGCPSLSRSLRQGGASARTKGHRSEIGGFSSLQKQELRREKALPPALHPVQRSPQLRSRRFAPRQRPFGRRRIFRYLLLQQLPPHLCVINIRRLV